MKKIFLFPLVAAFATTSSFTLTKHQLHHKHHKHVKRHDKDEDKKK